MRLDSDDKYFKYGENSPLCPDSGELMYEITDSLGGLPAGIEVWESQESGSLFIRTIKPYGNNHVDYTHEELNDVRRIARSILI